jgi:hypothetical protein
MRSPAWFVVAALVALGGLVGAYLYLAPRIGNLDSRLMQVVMPGSAMLTLAEPGEYTIYHEQKAVVDGRYYASATADGLTLRVESAAGRAVPLRQPGTNSSYSIGNRAGTSIFAFTVATPGTYRLTGTLAGGRSEPRIVLAVGQGFMGEIFGLVGITIAIVFGTLGIAGAILAMTLLQRAKARRTAAAS